MGLVDQDCVRSPPNVYKLDQAAASRIHYRGLAIGAGGDQSGGLPVESKAAGGLALTLGREDQKES